MDGMHVKADFAAVQMRQAALEYVYGQPFVRQGPIPGSKDIVVDAARKQRCLNRHMPGTEIQAQIPLETVFRLQILVPHLEAEGSFMFSVRAQFGQIRRPEPAGHVGAEREMIPQGPDSAQARADARKTAAEGLEPARQRFAAQPADIGPDTAGKRPCSQGFRGGSKETGIQEPIGRNQVLVAQIVTLLGHTRYPEGCLPVSADRSLPTEVVIQRIEAEVQTRFVR